MEHQEKLHQCVLFVSSFVTMTTALSQLSYHRMSGSSSGRNSGRLSLSWMSGCDGPSLHLRKVHLLIQLLFAVLLISDRHTPRSKEGWIEMNPVWLADEKMCRVDSMYHIAGFL